MNMKRSITEDKIKEKVQFIDEERMYHVCPSWNGGDLLSLYEQMGEEAYDAFAVKHGIGNGLVSAMHILCIAIIHWQRPRSTRGTGEEKYW